MDSVRQGLGLIVVAAAMIAIVAFMFRSLRSPAGAGGGLFSGFGAANTLEGFGGGLVAAVAVSTMLSSTSAGAGGAASGGALVAVAYFLLTRMGLTVGIRILSGVVGTAGFLALAVFVLAGSACTSVPLAQRILVLVLIVASGGVGAAASFLLGRPRLPSTLAAFGALKIAVFLSAPLGISLITLPVEAWVVSGAAAALLGSLSALAPQFVIGMTAAVIGVSSLAVGVVVGDSCTAGPDLSDLGALVGFGVVYLVLALVYRRR